MTEHDLPASIDEVVKGMGQLIELEALDQLRLKYKLSTTEMEYWLASLPKRVSLAEVDAFLYDVVQKPLDRLASAQANGNYRVHPENNEMERYFTCPNCGVEGFQSEVLENGVRLNRFNRLNEVCNECTNLSLASLQRQVTEARAEIKALMNGGLNLNPRRTKLCPVCLETFQPHYAVAEDAPKGTIWHEQHASGVCSEACWDKAVLRGSEA